MIALKIILWIALIIFIYGIYYIISWIKYYKSIPYFRVEKREEIRREIMMFIFKTMVYGPVVISAYFIMWSEL